MRITVGLQFCIMLMVLPSHSTFLPCPYKISQRSQRKPQLCGTDHKTYSTYCAFKKAQKLNRNLDVLHHGICVANDNKIHRVIKKSPPCTNNSCWGYWFGI